MLNSTCRTISVCKLLQIVNFDSLTFLTALVLLNQSDPLNHSNKDSGWLRTREKCGEALAFGSCFSHFSSILKNSQVLKNSTMLEEQVFLFLYKMYRKLHVLVPMT